jgi:fructose-bisphosphate aldolase class II
MALVPMRVLLDHAAENGYGLAALNVNNMEQIQAIMEAAKETNSPVIIQASRGARSYSQDNYLRHLMLAAVELYPSIPVCMHLDHGNSPATCQSAIMNGFTSVMMDGSLGEDGKTPTTYEQNVAVTKEVSRIAHMVGVSVEGELGCLGGIEDGHGAGISSEDAMKHLTDPDQAVQFVAETGVDALAVAIGTSHGAYKFTRKPDGAVLSMDTIKKIHAKLPNTHLVMHGSSSVPRGAAGPGQQVRRQAEAHLGRAGRGDPARHQARRAQDQRRHRQPPGHHGGHPQGVHGDAREVRPARLPQARARADEEGLRRAHGRLRAGRLGRQDQAGLAGRHGQALHGQVSAIADSKNARPPTRRGGRSLFRGGLCAISLPGRRGRT